MRVPQQLFRVHAITEYRNRHSIALEPYWPTISEEQETEIESRGEEVDEVMAPYESTFDLPTTRHRNTDVLWLHCWEGPPVAVGSIVALRMAPIEVPLWLAEEEHDGR